MFVPVLIWQRNDFKFPLDRANTNKKETVSQNLGSSSSKSIATICIGF